MAQRLRLYDVRVSRFPRVVGLCQGDTMRIAQYVNSIQSRLVLCKEAGEEGWIGGWAEVQFSVSQATPYMTFGPDISRLELVDICDRPVDVNNQFVEYQRFGNGRLPKQFTNCGQGCRWASSVYSRNNAPTFTDLSTPPQLLTVFMSDPTDANKRILLQGTDQNSNTIVSQDGNSRAQGIFLTLATPFVTTPLTFNTITGIQKDITNGTVQVFQTDPNSGAQVLLVTMQPWETTAWYRRYYFDRLPWSCCNPNGSPTTTSSVTVTAIAKLELLPVTFDTDYLMIQNLEAVIEEGQALRYSEMDSMDSKQLEAIKHRDAVRLLNGQISHVLGQKDPAINIALFGSARLERNRIGSLL
jgi:hypothetical protein